MLYTIIYIILSISTILNHNLIQNMTIKLCIVTQPNIIYLNEDTPNKLVFIHVSKNLEDLCNHTYIHVFFNI